MTLDQDGNIVVVGGTGSFGFDEVFILMYDPDGTLIEFVETHKIPIIKKIGWYLNLNIRKQHKALPNFMLKTLTWNRVK